MQFASNFQSAGVPLARSSCAGAFGRRPIMLAPLMLDAGAGFHFAVALSRGRSCHERSRLPAGASLRDDGALVLTLRRFLACSVAPTVDPFSSTLWGIASDPNILRMAFARIHSNFARC